jgi:hypothetical protein
MREELMSCTGHDRVQGDCARLQLYFAPWTWGCSFTLVSFPKTRSHDEEFTQSVLDFERKDHICSCSVVHRVTLYDECIASSEAP